MRWLIAGLTALSTLLSCVSLGHAGPVDLVKLASTPQDGVLLPKRQNIVSSTDMATVRLNLVNKKSREMLVRLRVYDHTEQEVKMGQLNEGIPINAGASKQVILIFPIGKAHEQDMRICAQQKIGEGEWVQKSCSQFRVHRVVKTTK